MINPMFREVWFDVIAYDIKMARIEEIINSKPGTPEHEELDDLSQWCWEYEEIYIPISDPSLGETRKARTCIHVRGILRSSQ